MSDVLTPSPLRRSLSVATAARIVGLHPSTIRRALKSGELTGYRAGSRGMYRIPATALEEWVRPAHEEDPAA